MSRFYGTVRGGRSEASRCGHKTTGLHTCAAGWKGAIRTDIWYDDILKEDRYSVSLIPWQGSDGYSKELVRGTLDAACPHNKLSFAFHSIKMAIEVLEQYNVSIES